MTFPHAVVLLDNHHAQVHTFDDTESDTKHVKDHVHGTVQHNSAVRTEHEFMGEVCEALTGVPEVLVTGSLIVQATFRHYVDKHRPALAKQIVGWEVVDHPTEGELIALGRKFFAGHQHPTSGPAAH